MKKILETFQLSKRFGGTVVLDGLNMSVPEGSIYGLLGPNGATDMAYGTNDQNHIPPLTVVRTSI